MAEKPNPSVIKGGLGELWPLVDSYLKMGADLDKRSFVAHTPKGTLHLYVWPKGDAPKGPLIEQGEEEKVSALKTWGPPIAAGIVGAFIGWALGKR